jgi:hypothetical protein
MGMNVQRSIFQVQAQAQASSYYSSSTRKLLQAFAVKRKFKVQEAAFQ